MRIKKLLKTFGLAALMGSMLAGVQACSDDGPEEGNVGTGQVYGHVTDEQSTPVEGVKVTLYGTENSTTTDAQGAYSLAGVPMTSGIITYEKDGYQQVAVTVTARRFTEAKAEIDVEMLYANAIIRGCVVDASNHNAPLEGVNVAVSATQSVTTDSNGEFELRNLILQNYTLTLSKEGYPSVTRQVAIADFVDGIASFDINMGQAEILRGLTLDQLLNAPKWYYNEYRGGRNAEDYPHWDWACNYMCTLEFTGAFEEQNEGTTLQIRNSSDQQGNPADMEMFDSFVYGSKLITADNHVMTLELRTHNADETNPAYYGVQVVDLSEAEPKATLIGDVRTLASEPYVSVPVDLSAYIGKEVVIAVGIFRQQTGDYWKQLVIRRIAFAPTAFPSLWGWAPGTEVTGLEGWHMTYEMVRSTMPHLKSAFTGISPISGSRDDYYSAYRAWRDVSHVAAEWCYMPLTKDPEVFPSEGYIIKTRGNEPPNTKVPESYFYAKFSIAPGHDRFTLTTRNFSSVNATFFKLTAITEDGTVTHLSPVSNTAHTMAEPAADGCWKFIHEAGGAGNPEDYCQFVYDLSAFDGKDVMLTLGVFKGEANGDENKLVLYSINLD